MLPDLAHLDAFVAVARRLHFGRAASDLSLTQSAVSHRIAGLERHLGLRLLDRSHRSVRLTDAGAAYLPRAIAAIETLADAHADARAAAAGASTRLVVGYVGAVTCTPLADAVANLLERYPEVAIELRGTTTEAAGRETETGTIDVAASFRAPAPTRGLEAVELSGAPLHAWCHPDAELAAVDELGFDHLGGQRLIVLAEFADPGMRSWVDRQLPLDGREVIEVNALDAAARLVSLGVGVAVLPAPSIEVAGVRAVPLRPERRPSLWIQHRERPSPLAAELVGTIADLATKRTGAP